MKLLSYSFILSLSQVYHPCNLHQGQILSMELEKFLGEKYPSIYHLVVTGKCNASCEECINTLIYGERSKVSSFW